MTKAIVGAAVLMAATVLRAQEVTGDWQGTLNAGGAELHLILHIAKDAGGGLTATLDSVDQQAKGIPIGPVSLAGRKMSFTSEAIKGSYEGTVNAEASSIDGTWTQGGQSFPLLFARPKKKAATPSDLDGDWQGTIDTGSVKLRVIFHIVNTESGLTATLDSPDQSAAGLPVTSVTRNGSSLRIEMKNLGASFDGKIAPDLKTIEGTFSQGGGDIPLVLKPAAKQAAAVERKRPQNPLKAQPVSR